MPRVTEALQRISRGHRAGALQVCISANKAGRFTGHVNSQMHSANSSDNSAGGGKCFVVHPPRNITDCRAKKTHRAVNIFLEFTPSGGSSAQSIPFMFGALHSIIVLLCKVNLFLKKNERLSL